MAMNRRRFLATGVGAGAAALVGTGTARAERPVRSAAFKHSVSRWPYGKLSADELARMAHDLKLDSVELLERDEWPIARSHGLSCAMGYAPVPEPRTRLTRGFNRAEHHTRLVPAYERALPLAPAPRCTHRRCTPGPRP